jgi:hypothetical protein
MILITSAEYVDKELQSNFGKLIPAFLPIKNKRLFYYQVNTLREDEVVLSIPESYIIDKNDLDLLDKLKVNIVKVPDNLKLGESILYCLDRIQNNNEFATILFGDTLISDTPSYDSEFISISKISQNYEWAKSGVIPDPDMTYTGLFNFKDISSLKSLIINHKFDFIKAVEEYKNKNDVKFIETNEWYDFGHLSTYYTSRSKFTTERHFNKIDFKDNRVIVKSSSQINKIQAEAFWYESIPDSLKISTPRCFNLQSTIDKASYDVEYLFIPVLNELFVFGKLPLFLWKQIIESCINFLEKIYEFKPSNLEAENDLFFKKTFYRLKQLQEQGFIDIYQTWNMNGSEFPSLSQIAKETKFEIQKFNFNHTSIMHGDFCFSNILYDFRSQSIKVIDPRGIDNDGKKTIYGDILYDITKLAHSIIGLYDFIIAGYYELSINSNRIITFQINTSENTKEIQNTFLNTKFKGERLEINFYLNQLIHLFLSMLPLHSENQDRQHALMSNALRLYSLKNELNGRKN